MVNILWLILSISIITLINGYLVSLYKDIRLWLRYSAVAKENRAILNQNNMRVDWLGRVYTVINITMEEIEHGNEYMREAWVLQQLRPYTKVLLQIGIADYSYPEVVKIADAPAYLVVMYPELNNISIKKLFINILMYIALFFVLKITFNIITEFVDFSAIGEIIMKYL